MANDDLAWVVAIGRIVWVHKHGDRKDFPGLFASGSIDFFIFPFDRLTVNEDVEIMTSD